MKKLTKSKVSFILLIVFATIVFLSILIRASITGLSFDEAFTFIEYCEKLPYIHSLRELPAILNNHWLNTILITLVTQLTGIHYSELLIRFPALLFALIYYVLIILQCKKGYLSSTQGIILSGNYLLAEFMGLARGYGMATTLVFIAAIYYNSWRKEDYASDKNLLLSIGFLILSAYANSITLFVLFAFGMVILIRFKKEHLLTFIKKHFIILFFYMCATVLILGWHYLASRGNNPVFSVEQTTTPLGYVAEFMNMFCGNLNVLKYAPIFFLIALCCGILYQTVITKTLLKSGNDFALMSAFIMILLVSMNTLFHKGSCTGRTLLPMFPIIALGVFEIFSPLKSKLAQKCNSLPSILSACISLIIIVLFFHNVNLTQTSDWSGNYKQAIIYRNSYFTAETTDASNSVSQFYQEKAEWESNYYFAKLIWRKGSE